MDTKQTLTVQIPGHPYNILLQRGILAEAGNHIDLNRKVMIITDDGVPEQYAEALFAQCQEGFIARVRQGEGAKSFPVYQSLCSQLLAHGFGRKDLVVALGGGVMGDLAGFVAATYMRGIEFCNIPTTTLSQIDSSIGGKVAINLDGVKNIIGSFYQPSLVLIDANVLRTLPQRHFYNGLVEAIKAGMIYDERLFETFESMTVQQLTEHVDDIIYQALQVKKAVVEQDEKEQNLRKILNFGHTLGHGIESVFGLEQLLHGEAVGIGMMLVLENPALKKRLKAVLEKLNLPTQVTYPLEQVYQIVTHDKKASGNTVTLVKVEELGKAVLEDVLLETVKTYLAEGLA